MPLKGSMGHAANRGRQIFFYPVCSGMTNNYI